MVQGLNLTGSKVFRTQPHQPWDPPGLLCSGYWVSVLGVKQPGHRIDHPFPSNIEVKERVEI